VNTVYCYILFAPLLFETIKALLLPDVGLARYSFVYACLSARGSMHIVEQFVSL